MNGLTDERISEKGFAEIGVAMDERAAGRGHMVGAFGVVETFEGEAAGIDPLVVWIARDVDRGRGRGDGRVTAGRMVGQGVVLDPDRVVATELVAPVVADAALLGQAGGGLDQAEVGLDPEIATAERQFLAAGSNDR